jgi:uncharacterized membrane protein
MGIKNDNRPTEYIYFTTTVEEPETIKSTDKYDKEVSHTGAIPEEEKKTKSEETEYIELDDTPADYNITEQTQTPFNISASQENTRAQIAKIYTIVFLTIIFLTITIPFLVAGISPNCINDPLATAKELVTMIASILGGSFGFIVGFYFKNDEN